MKFRTDLPLMGDKEVKGWIENIIENTNVIDIQILHEYIEAELEDRKMDMIFNRVTKMCDKCSITYPEHTDMCIRCNSTDLRSFKIHDNRKEIYKLIRPN